MLIYVGVITILNFFILILINVKIFKLLSNIDNNMLLAIVISIFFIYIINQVLFNSSIVYIDYINYLSSLLYGIKFLIKYISYILKILNINNYILLLFVINNI